MNCVQVIGDEALVAAVLTALRLSGQVDGPFQFTGSLEITLERGRGEHVEVDGVDGPVESTLVRHVAELSRSGCVLLRRRGGVQRDDCISLTVPPADVDAVARAISRTCYEVRPVSIPVITTAVAPAAPQPQPPQPPQPRGWFWQRGHRP